MKILADAAAARAVVPRPAATTLVVRDGPEGLEVLMVRRSPNASFMPGAYVFPGGAVDEADGAVAAAGALDEAIAHVEQRIGAVTGVGLQACAFAVAALRECFEECGLWLLPALRPEAPAAGLRDPAQVPPASLLRGLRRRLHAGEAFAALAAQAQLPLATSVLQPWSHWVTPLGLPKRFDTLFFVAAAPPDQAPSADEAETTTLAWVHPAAALAAHRGGGFPMEFATVQTMQSLAPFASRPAAALLAQAASHTHLPPLQPRLHLAPDGSRPLAILLPGQPGYDELGFR
jgi:8-oxo-dGTP pyrophosphatase MutT (NUDIX family)